MDITNTEGFADKRIARTLGMVTGSSVRACDAGTDLVSTLKNLVGGEMKAYTNLMNETRQQAMERMIEEAEAVGADAIVNVRFSSTSITTGAAEVFVVGTAVKLSHLASV